MAQLLRANKPTILVCTNNLDYEMEWDSEDMLFLVEYDDKILKELERDGYRMHPLVPEIIVWGKQLDFQTTYIARKEDFDELEMF
jgi:hypothetical protein